MLGIGNMLQFSNVTRIVCARPRCTVHGVYQEFTLQKKKKVFHLILAASEHLKNVYIHNYFECIDINLRTNEI